MANAGKHVPSAGMIIFLIASLAIIFWLCALNVAGFASAYGIVDIVRVSTGSEGQQSNRHSYAPSISGDERYVAFYTAATNLVTGDTNAAMDVFVKDRLTGGIIRASTDGGGNQASVDSGSPVLSYDGRYVAFESGSAFVPEDTNGIWDIYLKDTLTGGITLVSADVSGGIADGASHMPAITPDGRYAAFESEAANLVPDDTNGVSDVFLKDTQTGTITRVSSDSSGLGGNGNSYGPALTPGAELVTFESYASNLVDPDVNLHPDIFIKNMATGAIRLVSTNASGVQGDEDSGASCPVSADGRFVAFESETTNLAPGDTNWRDIFRKDLLTGAIGRASTDSAGAQSEGDISHPNLPSLSMSADGRFITFPSEAVNLVADDTNGVSDVFLKDMDSGMLTLISVSAEGTQANGRSSDSYGAPVISAAGNYVVFQSFASNLVPGDTNGRQDIFLVQVDMIAPLPGGINRDVVGLSGDISFNVTDPAPSSGLDPESIVATVDGSTFNGCSVAGSTLSCPVLGLTPGRHGISGSVADRGGNRANFSGSFEVQDCGVRPGLNIGLIDARWVGYQDYLDRMLTADYMVVSPDMTVFDAGVVGISNTQRVAAMTALPLALGRIDAGSSGILFPLRYRVPEGVDVFHSAVYATAANACSNVFEYPGHYPGD